MQQVVSNGSPGPLGQLLWTPDIHLLWEKALPTRYPAFAEDGSRGNLPGVTVTPMSQAHYQLTRHGLRMRRQVQNRRFLKMEKSAG
ncbi:zinc finger protein 311 [Rhinolophus ferrumequinum]|uniref:Zinc finger protein 311 n=1 Tax=Rhinolophus ferrumequinum TaxID=59479 RepID=A0A7J7YV24_RHIFE|nr:zinc finger protein 311 [Rhinolophus ferrumequinum]